MVQQKTGKVCYSLLAADAEQCSPLKADQGGSMMSALCLMLKEQLE